MKNSKSLSTLALVAVVFVAWACGCPKNLNLNNSNNSNNGNANNSNANNSNNSNRTVPSDFITKFVVSSNSVGVPETTSFGPTDKIYVIFSARNIPSGKGLKAKVVADSVEGVRAGASVEVTKDTKKGDSLNSFQFYFTPTPTWKPGTYHVELLLINDDGTEDVLKTQSLTVS